MAALIRARWRCIAAGRRRWSGVEGGRTLGEHVTELLDVRAAILAADPDFFATEETARQPYRENHHAGHRSAELIGAGR